MILLILVLGGIIVYFGPQLTLTILRDNHRFLSPIRFSPHADLFAAVTSAVFDILALIVAGRLIRGIFAERSLAFYRASFFALVRTVFFFVLVLLGIALTGALLFYLFMFLRHSANR